MGTVVVTAANGDSIASSSPVTSAELAAVLTDETGSGAAVFATSPTLVTPALGTPASGVATNLTGTAAGLTAGNVTTNANLTGVVTSVGNATAIADDALSIAKTSGLQSALDLKSPLASPTFTGTVTAPTIIVTTVLRLKGYTVATLPAGTQGDKAFVTDALGPTYLVAVVGGGAVVTEVFYNGTAWVCT